MIGDLLVESVEAFSERTELVFEGEILLGDCLRLVDRLRKLFEPLIQRGRLLGERASRSPLLIDLGHNGVVRGNGGWRGGETGPCGVAAHWSQVPTGARFDPVNTMAFVHRERITWIDVTPETIFLEFLRGAKRARINDAADGLSRGNDYSARRM